MRGRNETKAVTGAKRTAIHHAVTRTTEIDRSRDGSRGHEGRGNRSLRHRARRVAREPPREIDIFKSSSRTHPYSADGLTLRKQYESHSSDEQKSDQSRKSQSMRFSVENVQTRRLIEDFAPRAWKFSLEKPRGFGSRENIKSSSRTASRMVDKA